MIGPEPSPVANGIPEGFAHSDNVQMHPSANMGRARQAARGQTASDVRALRLVDVLDSNARQDLMAITTYRRLERHQSLVTEGSEAEYAYVVISGSLKAFNRLISGYTQTLAILRPGDFLGIPWLGVHTFSVDALEPTVLCRFPRRALRAVLAKHDAVWEYVMGLVQEELATERQNILQLNHKTAVERVASYIFHFVRRQERLGDGNGQHHLPLYRPQMVEFLGLSKEEVSYAISQLRIDGIIQLESPNVATVINRAWLERATGQ